uniref:ATP synthase subunit a n=1 Tax=Bactrothrips quadrituberculatus TaxID=1246465 RepID=A0A8E5JZK6_9NEOP|nr:ATP synthase F0 subunit 6 [Bactrothrips quadrituberculatus]QVD42818.1 ATP synthase F0 subunit 6 [Bactrothrips quadrituberculatus]
MNLLILLTIFLNPLNYWYYMSRYMYIIYNLAMFINKEFYILVNKKLFGGLIIYISLFYFILQFNFLGMFPYIFTLTSQLNFNVFLSLTFFLIFFLLGWLYLGKKMFAHLTPLGSPMILSPFLVLIELISLIIRPFTLSIRLTANIVSGHILMEIILEPSKNLSFFMFIYFLCVLPILILEIMVCFVQAFVISSLSSLYLGEPLH